MKGRVQLGSLFVMHALVGGLHQALRAKAPTHEKERGRVTATDIDNLQRAAEKRARKAAKLRRDHERSRG
jgi:hypothetical protein